MILVECRSRALYSSEWGGRAGNWVDGVLLRKPAGPSVDEDRLLAKVRVAGSNPVFRSKEPGQNPVRGGISAVRISAG